MLTLRSRREIDLMRQAGQLVWEAHRRASELIRPGVTTAELDAAIDQTFEQAGATALFKGVPGVVPFPAATCISVNEEVVHGIPGRRVLREGDIVSLDTGCQLAGWCGDSAYTYGVGAIDPQAKSLLQATRAALELAIERIPQREWWSEVAGEMQSLVERAGFQMIRAFVGHGIGRQLHEAPQVPNFTDAARKGDFQLRPGLVLAIEPMVVTGSPQVVCASDGWTQRTADGGRSAHFEHTVAIVEGGCEVLTGP